MTTTEQLEGICAELLRLYGVGFTATYLGEGLKGYAKGNKSYITDRYSIGLSHGHIEHHFDYTQGCGLRVNNIPVEPTIASVVWCLLGDSDAQNETFDSWCDLYDHDSDSRNAERMYNYCRTNAVKLNSVLAPKLQ